MSNSSGMRPRLKTHEAVIGRLRRDLGTAESYAALIGILIGAGIFKVTSQAWALTGPSVILGYVVLLPVILATSVPYAAFLSTPLGREPGGEYSHLSQTLGGYRLAFIGAWLKCISYIGAGAFLAVSLADYVIELSGGRLRPETFRVPLAVAGVCVFYAVHVFGIRWFGRIQVAMCTLLGISIVVLVVPGLFNLQAANYKPFITHGAAGFTESLVPLFFSYAGFESLAQTAGEVEDSTRRLPLVFLRGITLTAVIFVAMSAVAFGVLPGARLQASAAPMADVASVYLPWGAASFVTFGAIMAITTSLNSSLLVPSRLALMLAEDKLAPPWMGVIVSRTATPVPALTATLAACLLLIISKQVSLALNIAIFALVLLYFLHSLAFLALPRLNPDLARSITVRLPVWLMRVSGVVSVLAMGVLITVQIRQDIAVLRTQSLAARLGGRTLTSAELVLAWGAIGLALYLYAAWRRTRSAKSANADKR